MKKVLHISERASGGGAESVFRDTITALKGVRGEYTHLVACTYTNDIPFNIDLIFPVILSSKFRRYFSQIYSYGNYLLLTSFLKKENPDIIHVQNYGNLSPSILQALWKYKRKHNKVRIIHTVHTFEYICSHHAAYDYRREYRCTDCIKSTFKFRIFFRGCSRLGYAHSIGKGVASLISNFYVHLGVFDLWITPSDFLNDLMVKRGLNPSKVRTIRNPVPSVFMKKSELIDNEFSLLENDFNIIYFGRFSEEKNIDVLIRAFKLLLERDRCVKLTMIGNGAELDHLVRLIKECKLEDHVNIMDFMKQVTLINYIKNSQLAVIPSKCFESASMFVCEAVAMGVVPMVANHGGMKEMVEWLDCGTTFASGEVNDLANKIEGVMDNYNVYAKLVRNAFIKIESYMSLRTYASKIIKQYNEL